MAIQIRRVLPGQDVGAFLDVPRRVYQGDRTWVPPLDALATRRLDPRRNPFFEHAEAMYFVAERDGERVGRVSAQIDHEHQKRYADAAGFFGFLDTVEDPAVSAALLDAASAWLRERGMRSIRGPLSLNIWDEVGCQVDGFDEPPMFTMPHHRPYQAGLIEAARFAKLKDVLAWKYTMGEVPPRARKAHDELFKDPSLTVRCVDPRRLDAEVRTIMAVVADAWVDNWGFVPLTQSEIRQTARDLRFVLEPTIALIAEIDGEPAAVAVGVPNANEAVADLRGRLAPLGWAKALYRFKLRGVKSGRFMLLGIKKKFRAQRKWMPLSVALYAEMNKRGQALGMTFSELSWTLEDNHQVNVAIRSMGGKLYKRYRIYERAL